MSGVRDTSIKCYNEIKEEQKWDNDMEMVYDAIHRCPLMTGREIAEVVLGYTDMNKVRPRITDLKNEGCIVSIAKRECSLSKRTAYIWATLEGIEKLALKKANFDEVKPGLFAYREEDCICYQDFRGGKRKSYAMSESGNSIAYDKLDCYQMFKSILAHYLNPKQDEVDDESDIDYIN